MKVIAVVCTMLLASASATQVRSFEAISNAEARARVASLEAWMDADVQELGQAVREAARVLESAVALLEETAAPATKTEPAKSAAKTEKVIAAKGKAAVNATAAKTKIEAGKAATAPKALIASKVTAKTALSDQLSGLRRVYERLKAGIVRGNKHSAEEKQLAEEKIAKMKAKVLEDEKKLNSTKLSDFERALLKNNTRIDRAELVFWKSHIEHAHGAFHAQLKLSHGMMERIKGVTDMVEQAMKGKKVDIAKQLAALMLVPAKGASLLELSSGSVEATNNADARARAVSLENMEDAEAHELAAAVEIAGEALQGAMTMLWEAVAPVAKAQPGKPVAKTNSSAAVRANDKKAAASAPKAKAKSAVPHPAKVAAGNATAPKSLLAAKITAKAAAQSSVTMNDQLSSLRKVYERLQAGIARGNKYEQEGKKLAEEKIAKFEAKVIDDEKQVNSTKLTDFQHELAVNHTRIDRAELLFWKSHLQHSHGALHAQLHLSSAMMQKIKGVTDIVEETMKSGKVDEKKLTALMAAPTKDTALVQRGLTLRSTVRH